jgi:hypothetical protein
MVSTHQKLLLDTDAEKAKRKDSLDRRVMRAKDRHVHGYPQDEGIKGRTSEIRMGSVG